MSDILVRIKRAVLAGRYAFSEKARIEMECDGLTELDVAESILTAVAIYKKLRSTSRFRASREYLYVVQSTNLEGLAIYSKGKLVRESGLMCIIFLSRLNGWFEICESADVQPAAVRGQGNCARTGAARSAPSRTRSRI